MPFLRSAARPQAVECFFCLSPSVIPPLPQTASSSDRKGKGRAVAEVGTKWNWKCNLCQCWNVRDERGEMQSDLPAMHDPAFNKRSFSLRATPSTSHLPSSHASAKTFCHSCLANQTLIMNMLANYLPDDNDPGYPELHARLPSYLTSLHGRYPPVCPQCQPAVDEALRKADQKAQVEAWGSALRRGQNRRSGEDGDGTGIGRWEVLVWKARGVGFWTSAIVSWGVGAALWVRAYVAVPTHAAHLMESFQFAGMGLIALHLTSVLWFAWDPYWLRRRREHHRGRMKGRSAWLRSMLVVLFTRLVFSAPIASTRFRAILPFEWIARASLAVEGIAFLIAFASLRRPRPVALRLIRPTQLSVPSTPTYPTTAGPQSARYAHEPQSHHAIQQQQAPSAPLHHPVFGKTSLSPRPSLSRLRDSDMDWEPTPPPALYNGGYTSAGSARSPEIDDGGGGYGTGGDWDHFAVGKQRMFGQKESEDETGLEALLAGWGLADQAGGHAGGTTRGNGWGTGALRWFKGTKNKDE